ncbi:hypothetical protein CALCODRAFT_556296 [Calocera cornea HHB12733]|uniref:Gti1/Pac2 family-domain-containing protein n=1 Tax=Calocera cornea HHB12733 TaxID=1353952 RepID=A0A165EWP0_9BASI|nr:hypothetical protein CALCODRAFT_556296 [Calocera cornea HHB12733]
MESPLSACPYVPIRGAYVRDKTDALILCQAAHDGLVQQASQRLSIQQRKQLATSGSLFVFEKTAAEMERWTDGRGWSRSRQLPDKFFVYFEEYANVNGTASAGLSNDESTTPKRTKRNDPSDLIGALVGPLRFLPGFSPQVLIKKTITLKFPGKEWHVVSYFTVEEVLNGQLPSVSEHSQFQGAAMHVTDSSHSMGPILPSPPPNAPMSPARQGRLRSSTWSNGSGTAMEVVEHDMHGRLASCPTRGLQSRVVAPPRLDSLPRYNSYNGAVPVNSGLSSDPTSPVRRTGIPLARLDTSNPMSPNRRASAPQHGFTMYPNSGTASPVSAGFSFSSMPFHGTSLCTPPYSSSPQQSLGLESFGHSAYPVMMGDMVPSGSRPEHSSFHSPISASMNHSTWGMPESQQPISPSTCFDFEGYYSSTLTPDQGSQHSSPTIPELPSAGGAMAPESSSAVIDPFLEVGHWAFETDGTRDCMHDQITPKAFEHGPMSFNDGVLLSNNSDGTMEFHQMQWMDPSCTTWPNHA